MRILTGALVALCLAIPAHAQDERAARVAIAKDYIDATVTDADIEEFIRRLWQPMIQQMAANGQRLSEEQLAEIDKLFLDHLTQPLTDVMRKQDEVMADLMTLEELTALRDFYTSEHGGAVMRKMPQLAQIQQPMISATLQDAMPDIMPKIEAITTPQ
ncbi:hypothetical protein ROSMUCSMR3_00205 [Roseovarius mucosus]|uniref:DUF2059 domain-containing protein n=1 Tax=Roseovarius mucosus TaxID=215743 RepID=A0A1V0RJ84_9RHOB|nr:DUF2059 domain-containing protein [Roseovarius mucosus]ARE81715.1 hypothetical protein ROSMUCSMR3_00205 [Roseovarius mucosus]